MTDHEKLLALLADFNISPSETLGCCNAVGGCPCGRGPEVTLAANEGGVVGYDGFICVFTFDPEGKFRHLGLWE